MNTVMTTFLLLVGMTIGLIKTVPDVPVAKLVLALGALGVVLPVLLYPFTYTLWLALDLTVHPLTDTEAAEADLAAAR